MVLLCGIDGSAASREAARAAAAIAKRTRDSLRLVHVRDLLLPGLTLAPDPVLIPGAEQQEAERKRLIADLQREAERLTSDFKIEVTTEVRVGLPDHELDQAAKECDATLIAVASLGRRSGSMWRMGSTADRLTQSAGVAVLVVRDPTPFEQWALEDRPLQAMVALGDGITSAGALRVAESLRQAGPCDLLEVHTYDPMEEARRMGLREPESAETRRSIESSLARDLPRRFDELRGRGRVTFLAVPARGSTAETLVDVAASRPTDVIVLGTHGRGALSRRMRGSVSYAVIPAVSTNVLVARPVRERVAAVRGPVRVRNLLVATDFSSNSQHALQLALGLLVDESGPNGKSRGGKLTLLHVQVPEPLPRGLIPGYHAGQAEVREERRMDRALAQAELEKLVPAIEGLEVHCQVAESSDIPRAILQAAERNAAELLCLGTHGRGHLASVLLGSVAREVARRSPRPVLLVPATESR